MMLSCILCTKRHEPKFDWMADSFANALNAATFVSAELIVVDGCLWDGDEETTIRRRAQLTNAIGNRFSYRHVEPKPCAWQGPYRKTKLKDWYALNNARNTGIALARGTQIVLFDDCSVLDEQFLNWHWRVAARKSAMAGSFVSYTRAKVVNGKIVEGELHPLGKDNRGEAFVKAPGGWMYGLNCAFPRDFTLHINGYDEMYDGQGGSDDCDHGVRLERAGCQIVYVPTCISYQILETHEAVCETSSWGEPQKTPQKEKMLADGKMHFANEFLIQELAADTNRIQPRGNDFNLSALRKEVLSTGKFPTSRTVTHDWRDGAPLEEM